MRSLLILLFLSISLFGQTQKEKWKAEINQDIWKPFVEGVNTNNPNLYNGVNSKDFYWVLDGQKARIMNLQEYIEDADLVMKSRRDKGISTELQIRFLERNIRAEFASERIVIRFSQMTKDKKTTHYYSIANVFSKKENGVWKRWIFHYAGESSEKDYESAEVIK